MKKFGVLLFWLALFSIPGIPPEAADSNGIQLELIVRQKPAILDKYYEVTRDTVEVVDGGRVYTFLVDFSIDVFLNRVDSQYADFTCHLVTSGKAPFNYSNRFRIEYNLPARVENIPGKNNSLYQILISPRKRVFVDTAFCEFSPFAEGIYKSDPSADFQIYYVPNSLGDFHWNRVKGYLETDYEQFKKAMQFSDPGKINYYLCPCPAYTIDWDSRFGYAIDPARSCVYSIYGLDYKSTDIMLSNMVKLMKRWGYAPPILVEGLSGYFNFVAYEAKMAKEDGGFPAIFDILTTAGYMAADPLKAELAAASFVRYLTDRYGITRMKRLYEKCDDLTILKDLNQTYGKPLDSLEKEWLYYVDTVTLTRDQFEYYAARAEVISRYDKQIEYLEKMRLFDDSRADTLQTLHELGTAYYNQGRYYDAEGIYRDLIEIDSSRSIYWQIEGNLLMNIGQYDAAMLAFDSVFEKDTTYTAARLLQAEIERYRGDTSEAVRLVEKYYPLTTSIPTKIEFLLLRGEFSSQPGRYYDSAAAEEYFSEALKLSLDMIPKLPDDPAFKLRAGLACLGLGDYERARDFLEVAYFTESRAYYRGEVLLSLGRVYDLMGERQTALEYYRQCLTNQSAFRDHDLSRRYIDQPYSKT